MPRVSIGMPVYNGANYIEAALDSILCQTHRDFELIISDNSSTDATCDICSAYARADERVMYVRNEVNRGAAWNHNHVIHLASGEYFKLAAHDDMIAPNFLEQCVNALDENPKSVLAFADTVLVDESGALIEPYSPGTCGFDSPRAYVRFGARTARVRIRLPFLPIRLEDCRPIFGLMRMSALRATPLFGSYAGSDRILLAQLALRGGFSRVAEPLFLSRYHSGQSVHTHPRLQDQAVWFDPANGRRIVFPDWRFVAEFSNAVRDAPITAVEKIFCAGHIGSYLFWNWPRLIRDLYRAVEQAQNRKYRVAHRIQHA